MTTPFSLTQPGSANTLPQTGIGLAMPGLQLPDVRSTSELILAQAMEFCARKLGLTDGQATVERLRQGDPTASQYYTYSIAKQVAESLAALDEYVKAVYLMNYDATPEDSSLGERATLLPIHMIAWVERKTGALDSLIKGLDRALLQSYTTAIGPNRLALILDVQMTDDTDVRNRVGYGAMLTSLHQRPVQLWAR